MNKDKLNNRQFVTIILIIIVCGIAILGHDYFLAKKTKTYEEMSILLSEEPEEVEEVPNEVDTSRVVESNTTNTTQEAGDTSGKVKKSNYTYNYVGRIKIPKIKLNRGFVKYGTTGNTVNQNVAIMSGSTYPTAEGSHFILAAHSGSGWNAFFTNIDKLKIGDMAYITYSGKQYSYVLKKIFADSKTDRRVTIPRLSEKKQLTLVTCKRPGYKQNYLVLVFELTNEKDI